MILNIHDIAKYTIELPNGKFQFVYKEKLSWKDRIYGVWLVLTGKALVLKIERS